MLYCVAMNKQRLAGGTLNLISTREGVWLET